MASRFTGLLPRNFFELILYGNPVIYHVPVCWQHNLNSLTATQVNSNLACLAYNLICSLLAGFQGVVAVSVTVFKFSRGSQNTYKVPCGFAERGVVTSQMSRMSRRSSFPQSLSELFPPASLSFLRALTCQHIGSLGTLHHVSASDSILAASPLQGSIKRVGWRVPVI